jgi:pimeloyl-ACP methyl ester carboxylesterase
MAEHRIPVGGAELHVEARGSGRTVVLLHGFPLDHGMWEAQIEALAREFRVIAPDLRGFGKSTLEPDDVEQGVSMERYAADVVAALVALNVAEPVVLAGFSMGGYAAWQFALKHPQRLRGLSLVDTRAAGDADDAAANRRKMAQAVLDQRSVEPALAMLPKLLSAETHELRPEIVAAVTDMIERQSPEAIAAAQRGMARRPDVRGELPRIACPCLGIVGLSDTISPPKEMQEIIAALPDARLVEIPGGHTTPVENPDDVTAALKEFAESRSGEA